jgi:hypothetical protein
MKVWKKKAILAAAAFALPFTGAAQADWTANCTADDNLAAQGEILAGLAETLNLPFPNWESFDLDGDSVSDAWQQQLIAYATCSGNESVQADFDANLAEVATLISELSALVQYLQANHAAVTAFGTLLNASVQAPCNSPATLAGFPPLDSYFALLQSSLPGITTIGDAFLVVGAQMEDGGSEYAPFPPVLGLIDDLLASLGGQSTEANATILDIVPADDVAALNQALQVLAGLAQFEASCLSAIPSEAAAAAALLPALAAPPSLSVPAFAILDTGSKAPGEDFAGAGDYDGDSVTNGQIATYVEDAAGTANDFVAGATGELGPFWTGNPSLPIAGLGGLGALISVFGVSGAFALRRKQIKK